MKKVLLIAAVLFALPVPASAQQYYECAVAFDPSVGEACEAYRGRVHMCQLYNWTFTPGVPSHCTGFCLNRSGIPAECATVVVRQSNNPEAHEARGGEEEPVAPSIPNIPISDELIADLEQEGEALAERVNPDDGIDADEAKDIINTIGGFIGGLIGEKVDELRSGNEDEDIVISDDEENPFIDTGLDATQPGEYRTEKWPDEDGTKIAKIVDAYGVERYTSDGEHFYDNAYDAAHSGEGFSNIKNKVADAWEGFTDLFSFRGKLKDKDKELQREIAREVLGDAKSQKEKDVEKAYDKLSGKIKTPALGDVPAETIIEIAKETNETDFAEGALIYIEQRKAGKSPENIRENFSEELSEGYGTFRGGVSLGTTSKHAPAVLYARYEEAYQRYTLAKEFGREE